MLVSTTDILPQMNFYQIGRKSIIMNLSDLIVKNVKPRGLIISLGLPAELKQEEFIELMSGIIDYSIKFNIDYIGGDINDTKEIIINPTVFGFQCHSNIIYRHGMKAGDYLVSNRKFGLTGVGFDILLEKDGIINNFPSYQRSIKSVLDPEDIGEEAYFLTEKKIVTASIDSSDGLSKSLTELMLSNPELGFEIEFDDNLVDQEAVKYSQEYDISLEDLVFNAGEEFIHLFTISPENFIAAQKVVKDKGGDLFKIGKVISEEKIYILRNGKKSELKSRGYEHFK